MKQKLIYQFIEMANVLKKKLLVTLVKEFRETTIMGFCRGERD